MQPVLPLGVRVPGSSANLGPGFDTFGLALQIYLEARLYAGGGERPLVTCEGPNTEGIPLDASNLVLAAFRRAFEHAGSTAPSVGLELRSQIPLARGLGSSGAAIVAGIELADRCGRLGLAGEVKLALAAELERGHADNVSASLLGGFTVVCVNSAGIQAVSLPWPAPIGLLAAIPAVPLDTQQARAALPASYSRADAVFNLQHAALLATLLAAGRASSQAGMTLISRALSDRLHQPYRAPLVPGLDEALQLRLPGLLGVALSGAGPSLIAFVSSNRGQVISALEAVYAKLGVPCQVRPVEVSSRGPEELRVADACS